MLNFRQGNWGLETVCLTSIIHWSWSQDVILNQADYTAHIKNICIYKYIYLSISICLCLYRYICWFTVGFLSSPHSFVEGLSYYVRKAPDPAQPRAGSYRSPHLIWWWLWHVQTLHMPCTEPHTWYFPWNYSQGEAPLALRVQAPLGCVMCYILRSYDSGTP